MELLTSVKSYEELATATILSCVSTTFLIRCKSQRLIFFSSQMTVLLDAGQAYFCIAGLSHLSHKDGESFLLT